WDRHVRNLCSCESSSCGVQPGSSCDAKGYTIKPIANELLFLDSAGLLNKHQEGCLECIFRIVWIGQGPPADPHHHGTVAIQQLTKGVFVLLTDELLEQLAVGSITRSLAADYVAEVLKDLAEVSARHAFGVPGARLRLHVRVLHVSQEWFSLVRVIFHKANTQGDLRIEKFGPTPRRSVPDGSLKLVNNCR